MSASVSKRTFKKDQSKSSKLQSITSPAKSALNDNASAKTSKKVSKTVETL
jgi:hypothetical protein